jgi:signal peptidase II
MSQRPDIISPSSVWAVPLGLATTILITDQLTKLWVVNMLGPEPRTRELMLLGDWLSLRYIRNTGVAFGLFQEFPQLFTVTSILITLAAIYAYRYHLPYQRPWIQFSMGLIIGGALGNIVDRLRLGYVIDFVRVGWWPIFNVADSGVTVGVTMLALHLLIFGEEPATRPIPRDDNLLDELLSREPEG